MPRAGQCWQGPQCRWIWRLNIRVCQEQSTTISIAVYSTPWQISADDSFICSRRICTFGRPFFLACSWRVSNITTTSTVGNMTGILCAMISPPGRRQYALKMDAALSIIWALMARCMLKRRTSRLASCHWHGLVVRLYFPKHSLASMGMCTDQLFAKKVFISTFSTIHK